MGMLNILLRAGAWRNLQVKSQRQKTTNNFIFKGTVHKIYSKDAEAAKLEHNIHDAMHFSLE